MPRFLLEGPRPWTIFCFAFIHYQVPQHEDNSYCVLCFSISKSELKPKTKKLVECYNHSSLITMLWSWGQRGGGGWNSTSITRSRRFLFFSFLFFMVKVSASVSLNASINSSGAHTPPPRQPRGICSRCQSRGWGISKFYRGPGAGH